MLQVRTYHDYGFDDLARTIREDVVREGHSDGWAGDIETLKVLEDTLHQDGIRYVDDMLGRWEGVTAARE